MVLGSGFRHNVRVQGQRGVKKCVKVRKWYKLWIRELYDQQGYDPSDQLFGSPAHTGSKQPSYVALPSPHWHCVVCPHFTGIDGDESFNPIRQLGSNKWLDN